MARLTDKPLKIEGEACGKRIVDSLYKSGDLYYFVDIGWAEPISHPVHCIGKMTGASSEEWEFTDDIDRVFYITPIEDADSNGGIPMIKAYNDWKRYLQEKYPKANAVDFMKRDLGMPDAEFELIG